MLIWRKRFQKPSCEAMKTSRPCLSAALLVLPGTALCPEPPYAGPHRALLIRRVQGTSSGLREASARGGRRGSLAPSGRGGPPHGPGEPAAVPPRGPSPGRPHTGLGCSRFWRTWTSSLLASQTHPPQQSLRRELFPPRTPTPIPALLGGAAMEFLASGSDQAPVVAAAFAVKKPFSPQGCCVLIHLRLQPLASHLINSFSNETKIRRKTDFITESLCGTPDTNVTL